MTRMTINVTFSDSIAPAPERQDMQSDWYIQYSEDHPAWKWTADEIFAAMPDDRWCSFGEYDNTGAVLSLVKSGKLELDPEWNNRISGMTTSLRARKVRNAKAPPE